MTENQIFEVKASGFQRMTGTLCPYQDAPASAGRTDEERQLAIEAWDARLFDNFSAWRWHYPANARVPRIDPRTGLVCLITHPEHQPP